MKIKMTDTVATVDTCYTKGTEYDLPEAEAQSMIRNGVAFASDGSQPVTKPQPQKMDAKPSQPVEGLSALKAPVATEKGSGDAGTVQTAATVQAAETTAKNGSK